MPALSRRLVVGVTSAALLAGVVGFVPLLGSASAAGCPTWIDPAGDAAVRMLVTGSPAGDNEPTGQTQVDGLDIVKTSFSTDAAGGVSVVVTVKELSADGASNLPGDMFEVDFTAGGVGGTVYLLRDDYVGEQRYAQISNGDNFVTGTIAYDTKTNSVTGSFTPAQVLAGFGKAVKGLQFGGFVTTSYEYVDSGDQSFGGLGVPAHDKSTAATTLTYTDAGGCTVGAGGAPAPTGSGTPSPAPSGTPSPSPSPTATASPSPTSTTPAGPTLFDQPRKGCVAFTDAAGDAAPTPQGNDADLDVLAVNLKTLPDALQVFTKVATLGTRPTSTNGMILNGHRFAAAVTVGGKAIVATASADGPATVTVGGAANTDLKATAKFDTKNSNVVFTFPKDGLDKVAGPVAGGAAITGTKITTTAVQKESSQTRAGDTAEGVKPEEKTYAYGDNTCFLPPAGIVTIEADPSGQYGDTTELYATLTDVEESPVAGATVTAVLTGGKVVSATTDADGLADLVVPLSSAAGAKTLTVGFAGNAEVGAVKVTQAFKVVAEKTVLKAVGVKSGAKATVLDDDKRPVVGKPVTFLIGKTKKVVKTNAKGIAVLTGVKKGTAIKVSFPAVKGYYLGTPTYTVKAL